MIDRSLLTLRGVKRIFAILLVMAILQGLFTIAQAVSLATVITNLFNGEKLSSQLSPILFFVLIYISKHFMLFVRNRMMNVFAIKSGKSLRQQLNKKLFEVGPNITAKEGTGNVVTMALEGISQVEHFIQIFLPKIFNMLVIPALIFFYTLSLDIRSAIVLVVVLPTLLFFLIILGKAAKFRADKQYKTYQLLSNHFVDSLRGLETLRLLGLSKNYDRNIEQVSERYRKSTMGTLAIAFLSSFSLQFFTSLSVAIIALFLGLGLIDGEMALYPALVILILAPEYFGPIRDFGSDYHATLDGKNALTQIHQVIESPTLKKDNTAIESWNENSILTLSNVTVQYEEALKPSMNEVSFSWKGYGKIGIIGASGSGKSTLVQLLNGFLEPSRGDVQVNGQRISTLNNEYWQKQILYIPQKPYIFNDTLANNISFYNPDATKEMIERACKMAGLDQVVQTLPHGLDEVIGESGRMISGGQEQRVALARGFLDEKRKILIFDEPTAHLDIETEYEMKQQMLPLMENKLVFFATHRLHWMVEMDFILVLEQGKLVEMGTHDALLRKKGAYYQFVRAQLQGGEGD